MFRWNVARLNEHPEGAAPEEWLAPEELATLAGLTFPARRTKWLAGRWAAKQLLVRELDPAGKGPASKRDVILQNEASGAPYALFRGERLPWSVSLSHREDLGLCAVCTTPGVSLGADLELVEHRDRALVRQFFTDAEASEVEGAGAGEDLAVARIWSMKEAVLKALRTGLRLDTREIAVGAELPTRRDVPERWRPLDVKLTGEAASLSKGGALTALWRDQGRYVLSAVLLASPSSPAT
jgi:4'-phosphopantetheinyl transferase